MALAGLKNKGLSAAEALPAMRTPILMSLLNPRKPHVNKPNAYTKSCHADRMACKSPNPRQLRSSKLNRIPYERQCDDDGECEKPRQHDPITVAPLRPNECLPSHTRNVAQRTGRRPPRKLARTLAAAPTPELRLSAVVRWTEGLDHILTQSGDSYRTARSRRGFLVGAVRATLPKGVSKGRCKSA